MRKNIFFILLMTFFIGCASIPKQSAMLSQELSAMIRNTRNAHIALLDEYLLERRSRIDDFMEYKWIPNFMENFTRESKVIQELAKTNDPIEKSKIIQEFGEAASNRIKERRTAVVDTLYDIGRILRVRIEKHYDQMEITNETLTAHLRSVEKVNTTRDEMLKTINLPLKEIIPMDKITNTLDKISEYEGKIESLGTLLKEAKDTFIQEEKNGK